MQCVEKKNKSGIMIRKFRKIPHCKEEKKKIAHILFFYYEILICTSVFKSAHKYYYYPIRKFA